MSDALRAKAQLVGGLRADVEDAAGDEGAAVVDAHDDVLPAHRHLDVRPKGQRLVGGGQLVVGIEALAVGGLVAGKAGPVPGAHA